MFIESQVYDLNDARTLVAKVLVALATYEDKLAQKLLDDHFVSDDDGQYIWPDESDSD